MRFGQAIASLALLLPACSGDGDVDIPARKSGLWETSETTTIGRDVSRPRIAQYCIDAATDKAMRAFDGGLRQAKCSRQDLRRRSNALVLDVECKNGDLAFTAHGVSTGNFETDYTTKLTVKRIGNPAWPMIPPEMVITTEARWVAACRVGQKPGDMLLPDGRTMNIRSVPGMADLVRAPAAPAVAPIVPAPPAVATEMPARRPGLWEVQNRVVGDPLPPQSEKICVSAELDREMNAVDSNDPGAGSGSTCTQKVERVGNSYMTEGKCVGHPTTTLLRAVTSGDFQRKLTSEITMTREDGQPFGPGLPNMHLAKQDARWLSACPADMRPGDILMPDGTKRNFREVRRAAR